MGAAGWTISIVVIVIVLVWGLPARSGVAPVTRFVAGVVEHVCRLQPDEPAVAARERKRLGTPIERSAPDRVVECDPFIPPVPLLIAAERTGHARSPTSQVVEDGRLRRHSPCHRSASPCAVRDAKVIQEIRGE